MYALLGIMVKENISQIAENIKSIFQNFYWTDAIDIVILAVLFYFVFSFFRSRKAGTLLIGIFLCLIVYTLAVVFGLRGVEYILSGIFKIGALAIIIIFQPEIRDLLETIGSGSIKGIKNIGENAKKKQAKYKAIDNICKAVNVMSKERTGALIVIGRTTQLDDVTHSGIEINADVSDYLLRNLFYNKAPLHDGAVIIAEGRIAAAGCILPLSGKQNISKDLGTRHRAGLGQSEAYDSLSVIVSEETGAISLAEGGVLKRHLAPETLERLLTAKLMPEEEKKKPNLMDRVKGWITKLKT